MGEQLLGRAYGDREELALDIENSAILVEGVSGDGDRAAEDARQKFAAKQQQVQADAYAPAQNAVGPPDGGGPTGTGRSSPWISKIPPS